MAAARSAAAAPYPAPASHPPAGQPKRNILPRVAGLSSGQAPPQKVQKLTPLAWPVPNKKALPHLQESKVKQLKTQLARPVPKKKASPHPQESPNPAVLSSANPSTSGSGETGELVAQIGLAHGQRRGYCTPHNSFVNLMVSDAKAEVPRRSDDSYPHRSTNSRATHINANQMSAAASWSELSWDQGDVEALNDSYQLLNETVVGSETARPSRKEATTKQLGPSESSTAEKEPKKKTAPINIHLKREIETLRRKNEQMQAKIRAVSNPVDRTEGGGPPTAPTIKTNWSRYWTSCDSLTSISPSMQPCYCVNCKRKQNRQTVSQVVEHVSRVTPRLRFQSFGRFSNANGLPTMPCLSSDATATPSMGSCLSLNDTATPSMKSCLSPPILSAQSTHSMVTCLTSDGHPMEPEIPENGIPDPGWTSPMVVTAISSLPIPPQVPCGTQTEEQPTISARGPRFKTEKRRTRLARGRAKSARKLRAALNVWTQILTAISSLPIAPQVPCGTQKGEQPSTSARGPRLKTKKRKKSSRKLSAAPQLCKKILVGTVVGFLFVGMIIALFFTDVP